MKEFIFKQKDHFFQNLKGEKSYLFEYRPRDLEHLSSSLCEQKIKEFENYLINQDLGRWLKVYKLNDRFFINKSNEEQFFDTQMNLVTDEILWNQSEINYFEDYFLYRQEYWRFVTVTKPIVKIHFELFHELPDFVLSLRRYRPHEAKTKVDIRRRMHFSKMFKNLKDIDSEKSFSTSENLLTDLIDQNKALFDGEMTFFVKSSTKVALDLDTNNLLENLKRMNADAIVEKASLKYSVLKLSVGINPTFDRKLLLTSDYLSELIPLTRDELYLGGVSLSARSGEAVKLDLFSPLNLNFNTLITGPSGQGKSMIANYFIHHELEQGTKIVCIDLGNSFKKLAQYHNALILSQSFNPLMFKGARYLKEFILASCPSIKNEGKLFARIKEFLEKTPDFQFKELLDALTPSFPDVIDDFSETYDFFSKENLEPQNFLYCDLTLYPEVIKAPLLIFLIEYFKNLTGKKLFVFDECWGLLNKNARYIEECFRTFRKHNASAIAISQGLNDFIKTDLGRVVAENSFLKLYFRQDLAPNDFVNDEFLNIVHKLHSKKDEYSEFLLYSELHRKTLRFYPDHFYYELFHSSPKENLQFQKYFDQVSHFLDFKSAINNYINLKYIQSGGHV